MTRILVADPLAEEGLRLLKEKGFEVVVRTDLSPDELKEAIKDQDALIVRSRTKVSREVIEAGDRLQVIGRAGVGVDNIDVKAATEKGILVFNAPTGNVLAAAEHTIALMLALARHIPQAHSLLREGIWRKSDFMGVELRGKTLGIIGLGNVGSAVAKRAQGLEMRVIAHDPYISPEYAQRLGVEMVSLPQLLSTSDFISLHVPLNESTRGMIGRKELSLAKPGAMLINTARGGLIDEEALAEAIEEGRIAGAALDVFAEEPPGDNILLKNPKVIATPHIAGSTVEAQTSISIDVAQQLISFFEGKLPRYAVNAPLVPPEQLSFLSPYISVGQLVGKLAAQLYEGQINRLHIKYEGDIANYDTSPIKGGVLSGVFGMVTEERVNLINAQEMARRKGIKVVEERSVSYEVYNNLISLTIQATGGETLISGTLIREQPHIVRVNDFWLDIIPTGGYFLFCDHKDRPGLIGAVGTITGSVDVNIHSMVLGRLKVRGPALMVLGLDEKLGDEQIKQILAIPDIYTAKQVKL